MSRRRKMYAMVRSRPTSRHNADLPSHASQRVRLSRRGPLGQRSEQLPFAPPENWYESEGPGKDYSVIVQSPGQGYRHVLSEQDIRQRLADLPRHFVEPLEVIQLSRMTRKKHSFPCYGMQWGTSLYLYPIEDDLVETFHQPPRPALINEVKMYGGRWKISGPSEWRLIWSETAIQDFYLNNILIHELGHLLDDRNSSYAERERYAEWFAIEYGYRQTGGAQARAPRRRVRRRHHAT